jgi:hypothetical protein
MNNILKISGIVVLALLLALGGFIAGMTFSGRAAGPVGQNGFFGPGSMMGQRGAYGYSVPGGMMGGIVPDASLAPAQGQQMTMDRAKQVFEAYLKTYGGNNLKLTEVIQFDNQFYAEVHEKDTGIGAFELLIDPVTAAVYPEPGPNMMWNTRYGMMGGQGMIGGGMMGGYGYRGATGGAMTITPDEAKTLAQAELDRALPGVKVGDEAEMFYGYYTIDTKRDGKIIGMLSVNGYTGAVWIHTWHGQFIDMIKVED